VVVRTGRRELTLRYVTTQYVEPERVVIEARSRMLTSVDRISIAVDSGAGCLVTYDAQLTLNGLGRCGDILMNPMLNKIGDRAGRGLVAALHGEVVGA
jgi:hypothetical protein